MPRGELRTELIACLRQARKSRRLRARGADRRSTIPNMVSIQMRPPEIDDRVMPGHWEGDQIKGARTASTVGTLVERSTLFVALAKMDHATAAAAVTGLETVLNRSNAQRHLSLTYDRGREIAQPERLAGMTGIKVYFAALHSPWQGGSNENTNGLLRRYFPNGTNLYGFTDIELDNIAWQLHTCPRKSLGCKCPAEPLLRDSLVFFQIPINS